MAAVVVQFAPMKEQERLREVISLWCNRPEKERTETGVLIFYGWLEQNRPELLKRGHGDPYQHLQVDLRTHILNPKQIPRELSKKGNPDE